MQTVIAQGIQSHAKPFVYSIAMISVREVEHDHRHHFNIVLTDREDVSDLFHAPKAAPIPRILDKTRPDPARLDDDTMMTLLKDVYSVDTRFLFTADNRFTDVSLWVHRSILSKHQVFS